MTLCAANQREAKDISTHHTATYRIPRWKKCSRCAKMASDVAINGGRMVVSTERDCCCATDSIIITDEPKIKLQDTNNVVVAAAAAAVVATELQPALSPPVQFMRNIEETIMHYGILDMVWVVFSVMTYTFDQTTDVLVAIYFYSHQRYWYFTLTLTFIVIPALTMTTFSLAWYIHDYKRGLRPPASRLQWTFRAISLFLHFGPILRYIESLVYGCKSRCKGKERQRVLFFMMIYEDTDAGLLRLFESFMEAAPQLVLQICILARNDMPENIDHPFKSLQMASIFSSLTSLSWALASYNRSLRFSLDHKRNMTWSGTIVQFFWFFFNIASRVLALALFASVYPRYIFVVCFLHFLGMTTWIYLQKTEFCMKRWQEFFFDFVMGLVYIFCFFNVKDEPTRNKYIFYYLVVFCEGATLMSLWYLSSDPHVWYRYPAYAGFFVLFATSLLVMVVYYYFCHPLLRSKDQTMFATTTEEIYQTDGPQRSTLRLYPDLANGCPRRCSKIGRITEIDLNKINNRKQNENVPIQKWYETP